MPGITTCLWFDGQAEEAAHFYTSIFKNSSIGDISRYRDVGPGRPGAVMTVSFELDGKPYVGLNGGPQFPFTEAVSLQVHCETQDEVDHYWESLLAGGGEEGQCGWLKDKFGFSWQIIPTPLFALLSDPDAGRAARAMDAMMTMRKIEIGEIRRAADAGA